MSDLLKNDIFAHIKVNDTNYSSIITAVKDDTTNNVTMIINYVCEAKPIKIEISIPAEKVVTAAKSALEFNGISHEQPAMLHFLALMDALEIPHPEWWITQPPQALKAVAGCIMKQAKDMYEINEGK